MNIIKKMLVAFSAIAIMCTTQCCNISDYTKKMLWDSGPIANIAHGGEFKGYAYVYTIDWIDGTYSQSDEEYRVYKKLNGDYVIDYERQNYLLQEADKPIDAGINTLKWKLDYNHYIESIPSSY